MEDDEIEDPTEVYLLKRKMWGPTRLSKWNISRGTHTLIEMEMGIKWWYDWEALRRSPTQWVPKCCEQWGLLGGEASRVASKELTSAGAVTGACACEVLADALYVLLFHQFPCDFPCLLRQPKIPSFLLLLNSLGEHTFCYTLWHNLHIY